MMATMVEQKVLKNTPDVNSAFKQQRLKAWQPILTPLWVILTFVVIGVCFIPIGITLKLQSDAVFEQTIYYDSATTALVECKISKVNEGYIAIQNRNPKNCQVTFTFTKNIPVNQPVNVYYQLTNFYQNHRRYVKSRNDAQVGGGLVADSTLATSCDPVASFKVNSTGLIYAPCGLIATSFFNDGIFLENFNGVDATGVVSMSTTNIAWKSDLETKFKNPTGAALNAWNTYQYLWQTYDQMSCYLNNTKPSNATYVTCQTWEDVVAPLPEFDPPIFGTGCAKCPLGSVPRYEGGIPPPNGQEFDPTPGTTTVVPNSPGGFRDEHFVVWMRTAGLPQFRKLYGVLQPPTGGFKAGDNITFSIVPNFEVASFSSTKALILSTTTPTGGRSDVLGIAYLTVGTLCLALAIAFLIKHIVSPRQLGDPTYIVWRHSTKQ